MDTAIKERPILFSGPMVRAILDGSKTQTRRVVKPQPPMGCEYLMNGAGDKACCYAPDRDLGNFTGPCWVPPTPTSKDHLLPCPYGKPGDRLWVRETFSLDHKPFYPHYPIVYRAGGYPGAHDIVDGHIESPEAGGKKYPFKWTPSIHMPRWASRITLEITDVRVERLQDISTNGILAEGIEFTRNGMYRPAGWPPELFRKHARSFGVDDPAVAAFGSSVSSQSAFRVLWDSINAKKHPWADNPWVWAVTFKRLEAGG